MKNSIFDRIFQYMMIMPGKVSLLILTLLMNVTGLYSQRISRQEYIQKYQILAIKEMIRSGIPASIKMAQACLESDDGNSTLAGMSNNHFGIKCKSDWTGDYVLFDDDARDECFRKYAAVEDSYIDHTNFLANNTRYAFLFQFKPNDYKAWAHGLKSAGYATARDYPQKLIRIIEEFELYRLDEKVSPDELATLEQNKLGHTIDNSLTINLFQPRKIEKINGLKAIIAREGDTFETISQEFGLKTWELYRFNDYYQGYQPVVNEILYLQGKNCRSGKNKLTHTAEADESMHFISQSYGIKLKPLYRRNRMAFGDQPQPGQVIDLRYKKKG